MEQQTVIKTLTDLSTFDPMLKDVVVSSSRKDFQFYGKREFPRATNELTKKTIESQYTGFDF